MTATLEHQLKQLQRDFVHYKEDVDGSLEMFWGFWMSSLFQRFDSVYAQSMIMRAEIDDLKRDICELRNTMEAKNNALHVDLIKALGIIDRKGALQHNKTLANVEREHIIGMLAVNNGNKTRTARKLGCNVKTLYNKMSAYGLHVPQTRTNGDADGEEEGRDDGER